MPLTAKAKAALLWAEKKGSQKSMLLLWGPGRHEGVAFAHAVKDG